MKFNKKLKIFYILDIIIIIVSLALTNYFDMLPGYGMMPGLTYFSQVIGSLLAFCISAFAFIIVTIIIIIVRVIKCLKK